MGLNCCIQQQITLHVNLNNNLVDRHAYMSHGTFHRCLMAVAFILGFALQVVI